MKKKIIASKKYIILGLIAFLLASFCLCALIDVFYIDNLLFVNIIFILAIAFFIGACIAALMLLYIAAYKYWLDDSVLHKVNIFNVDKKIPIEDIVLIMKIQKYNFSDYYYLIIEKDFFKQNKNIIRKKSTIFCNGESNLFIADIMNKNPKINYAIDVESAWLNYCFVFRKINWLLKKSQKKNVSLKITFHNNLKPVEEFHFENIDFIQAEMNCDGKMICEKICIVKNCKLINGQFSKGYVITPAYKVIKKMLKKIK